MASVIYWVVVIAISLLSYYAAMRAQKNQNLNAGTVDAPTVNQGDRLYKLYGTRLIKNPKVVYFGSTTSEAIQK